MCRDVHYLEKKLGFSKKPSFLFSLLFRIIKRENLVIFTINSGNFDAGFNITLKWKEIIENKIIDQETSGKIPKNLSIVDLYKTWLLCYYKFVNPLEIKCDDFQFYDDFENEPNPPLNNSEINVYEALQISKQNQKELRQNCVQAAENLKNELKNWLKISENEPEWNKIREAFVGIKLEKIKPVINISEAIKLEDREILDKLPWYEWDLLKSTSPRTEIAISYNNYSVNQQNIKAKKHSLVRILPIFGDPTALELQHKEKESILKLKEIAEIPEFLEKPSQKELVNVLRNKEGWDILIYSGHGKDNKLKIRNLAGNELNEFEQSLRFAIENGLKIVILNCCDSLKIANELLSYGVHLVIAMKEEVIEEVAAQFLDDFLTEYALNNKSIYESVQLARDSLEKFDNKDGDYPSAMFFPVICQNLAIIPPLYKDLFEPKLKQLSQKKLPLILTASLISLISILGINHIGLLEKIELKAYDLMLTSRPMEDLDKRILVVTIDENDLEIARKNNPEISQDNYIISDLMLAQVLNTLKSYHPRVIGLDIFRDIPVGKGQKELVNQFKSQDNLSVICQDIESNKPGTSSPPEIPPEFVTLASILPDINSDSVVRRQLLFQDKREGKSSCNTTMTLSFQLALHYLNQENYHPQTTLDNQLQINKKLFKKLTNHSGGYNKLDDGGYQILLNYRGKVENSLEKISITDVLNRPDLAQQYQDKIILIGYNFSDINIKKDDVFPTPYGKMRGVFIHGQMVSQILSTTLDNRQLITAIPQIWSIIWLIFWLTTAGILIYYFNDPVRQNFAIVITIILIPVSSYLFLWVGGLWLPVIDPIFVLALSNGLIIMINKF